MQPEEKKELIEAMAEAMNTTMDNRKKMDDAKHEKHHQFLDYWIEKEERKRELIQNTKKQVFAWGLITFITGIGYAVYDSIIHALSKH